jgi:hypothetical protein
LKRPTDDTDSLPHQDQRPVSPGARRRIRTRPLLFTAIAAILGFECFLVVTGIRLYRRRFQPLLPPPTRAPIAQPGGMLRQVVGGDPHDAGEWSSDGKRLLLVIDDSQARMDFLAHLWDAGRAVGVSSDTFPGTIWCFAIVPADGGHPRIVRMPRGLNPLRPLWRPGTPEVAVSTMRLRMSKRRVVTDWATWMFEVNSGRLGRRLFAGTTGPESWSPNGRYLLFSVHGRADNAVENFVVDVETGARPNIVAPAKPEWIDRGQWSPDSRLIVFRWHTYRPARYEFQQWPCRGLWVADPESGSARLIKTGPIGPFCWLPDGRMLVAHTTRTHDGDSFRIGTVKPLDNEVAWLPGSWPGHCTELQQGGGRVVARIVRLHRPRPSRSRASDVNLWAVSSADGALRRLTNLSEGCLGSWNLSPLGDKIAIAADSFTKDLPGVWVLDVDASRGSSHSQPN